MKITYLIFTAALLVIPTANAAPSEINAPVGGSITEITAFYNQYANAVKTADRITVIKHNMRDVNMDIPVVLRALMPREMLRDFSNQNITITETFVNGTGTNDTSLFLNDFMPVNGRPFVSQLRVSHVQSANCMKQGDNWVVTIRLKDEALAALRRNAGNVENIPEADRENFMGEMLLNSGYGSSMELGLNDMLNRERPNRQQRSGNQGPGSISNEGGFQNGTIIAIINHEGQLTSLTHSYNMNMSFTVLLTKAKMNITSRQEYTFVYP
jgi:hypothetical protein